MSSLPGYRIRSSTSTPLQRKVLNRLGSLPGARSGFILGPRSECSVKSCVVVVPLFWLQTEDHDFAEIDHTFVPHAGGLARLSARDDRGAAARVAVAHRCWGAEGGVGADAHPEPQRITV